MPPIYKLLTPGKHLGFQPLIELISAAVYLISLLSFTVPPTINSHKATRLSFKNQVFCTPKHFWVPCSLSNKVGILKSSTQSSSTCTQPIFFPSSRQSNSSFKIELFRNPWKCLELFEYWVLDHVKEISFFTPCFYHSDPISSFQCYYYHRIFMIPSACKLFSILK